MRAILILVTAAAAAQTPASFERTVQPFVARHCALCHNEKLKTGGLDLAAYRATAAALNDRQVWEKVLVKLRAGEMPPKEQPRPAPAQIAAVTRWIETELDRLDRAAQPDPGRVTARRLNRVDYNNTVRDLLAVDFRPGPAEDFPVDDEGYGFDNIGDVLSLSPVLMEKYLAAAEKIARAAVAIVPQLKPTVERYKAEPLGPAGGALRAKHRFPAGAEYDLRAGLGGLRPDGSPIVKLALSLDGLPVKTFDVDPNRGRPRSFELRIPVAGGDRVLEASFVNDDFKPEDNPLAPRDRHLAIDFLEVRGPFNIATPALTESHRRIFACGHAAGGHEPGCARAILGPLARRAYRRPVAAAEIGALARFVALAEKEAESFEHGIRLALQAMLVSPHFLFRIERHPAPNDPQAVHAIGDHELATRLSYFLWSSLPDADLDRAADEKRLRQPAALEAQVRRMLADPKSAALVENFGGQWLQLRNLDNAKPDPDRFPAFDDGLRDAMRRETRLFFETVVREDRSILDFLDARFTFLNERLARHYGIPGVRGEEFRRVSLGGSQRGGILTQASVLTVSSYPTRTSPVLRGKWLLENILGAAPPPPPPGAEGLDEAAVGVTGSLRQQMERHRASASCAVCHARMDALGFALENYDAIGAWRARDGKFPVDSSATLPNGKSFQGPAELKAILVADRDSFARCLTEKMLTYALGRGLERYDRAAVELIRRRLAADNYPFSRLVVDIAGSLPFQNRRGDQLQR